MYAKIAVMIITILVVLGLCLGSFVNALVYRLHEQAKDKKPKAKSQKNADLSIVRGRSMCVDCGHALAASDLIPVFSWVALRGKCRYCHKPISWQYPLVELAAVCLFVSSYLSWNTSWSIDAAIMFGFWLVFLTGFLALVIYDFRWYLLPNRIVYPLMGFGLVQVIIHALLSRNAGVIPESLLAATVGGGLFYVLFQISNGRWIGGGDVKLGFLLGLVLGTPSRSLLMIFLASLIGSLITVPLLLSGKANRNSHIPFGPFLIAGTFIVQLYGMQIIDWYQSILLPIG